MGSHLKCFNTTCFSREIRTKYSYCSYYLFSFITVDCCVNHIVWCFTTQGMVSVGQEEIVTALEVSPDETTVPRDIFTHLYTLYEEASKGIVSKTTVNVNEMKKS